MPDIEFPDGLMAKKPHERAPDFVKCNLSVKRLDMIRWLEGKTDEWINLQVLENKSGVYYAKVDSWKREERREEPVSSFPGDDTATGYSGEIAF